MKKIKILLIDQNEVFRKGLSKLLEENSIFSMVGDFRNIEESKDALQNNMIDVVILDLKNLKELKEIQSYNSKIKVIGLSENTNINFVIKLLKKGMSSYLLKMTSLEEVIKTIQCVGQGETYFPSEISSLLFRTLSKPSKKINAKVNNYNMENTILTHREMEILKYITEEYTNREIAAKLFISTRTVDAHRRNLLSKLEVKNTVGLVKYYLRFISGVSSFSS